MSERKPADPFNDFLTNNPVPESQISLDDFDILKVIGRGSYAKVLMV
jgi:hypothetical protein